MTERLTLYDSRALLGSAEAPLAPEDPRSVAACFRDDPGLRLALAGHKRVKAYEAWLWEGNDGQGYFSKRFANGKTMAWRPGATVGRILARSPSLARGIQEKLKSRGDQE